MQGLKLAVGMMELSLCVYTCEREVQHSPSSWFVGAAGPEGKQLDATSPALQISVVAMCYSAPLPSPTGPPC